ncbi:hypothetical protein CH63R_02840 [Colletotrichum higginsianum IMI 349063]|uniref:Uncharacterized protein n=2 Tax=Colletotrichum higginsianum TaxID=80884 RepID=A0A1B7YQ93_COLHI|nr:hypothetical protein CH63R_02840 [Colletotrichum higginsianum IMI 349063]OBR14114.1 hypothetical protein CH63R_02840 [Colletotrichum higginsianum IMI 349063]TID01948.1 hypothetical protein CH35J_004272 [Colletotrichum higginsianum]
MFVSLQEQQQQQRQHVMDQTPPPMRYHQSRDDEVPRVLPSLSSFTFDDRMEVDARGSSSSSRSNDTKPGQRHEVEVATTLASMASFNIKSPTFPSPTQSFSSIKSDGMTRSTNSQFSSPEPRSPDLPSVNTQLSFSKDGGNGTAPMITLPRLRDLDLRPLESDFTSSPSFLPPSSSSSISGTGLRRSSIDSVGTSSFTEPRIDISSPPAYRIPLPPMPPMAYPDALPSPTLGASHHHHHHHHSHSHAHHSHPLSPPRRLQHRLPVTALRTSSGACSPSRRPRRSPTGSRCNVKYTIQQVDFIDYFRVDHHLSWKEVEAKYASVFPEDAAKGHKRGPQGLQGVYYRKNKQIPATDPNNLLVFDEDDNPKTFQCDVREQGKKMNNSIGLLGMHPERAITYAWVSEEHKRQYEKLGLARQAQLDAAEARKKRRRAIQNSRL